MSLEELTSKSYGTHIFIYSKKKWNYSLLRLHASNPKDYLDV